MRTPRKWEWISFQLNKLEAPDHIIKAAKKIDGRLIKHKLTEPTPYWLNFIDAIREHKKRVTYDMLYMIVKNSTSCPACKMYDDKCDLCPLQEGNSSYAHCMFEVFTVATYIKNAGYGIDFYEVDMLKALVTVWEEKQKIKKR